MYVIRFIFFFKGGIELFFVKLKIFIGVGKIVGILLKFILVFCFFLLNIYFIFIFNFLFMVYFR